MDFRNKLPRPGNIEESKELTKRAAEAWNNLTIGEKQVRGCFWGGHWFYALIQRQR